MDSSQDVLDVCRGVVKTSGPSEVEWTVMQFTFTRLYREEKKTLPWISNHLLQMYGYKASSKMYKDHIRKWGLDKKRKKSEMLFALKTIRKRRQQGRDTRISIRGEEVSESDILKYFKRQRSTKSADTTACEDVATPVDVRYDTPLPGKKQLSAPTSANVEPLIPSYKDLPYNSNPQPVMEGQYFDPASPTAVFDNFLDSFNWPVDRSWPQTRAIRQKPEYPSLSSNYQLAKLKGTSDIAENLPNAMLQSLFVNASRMMAIADPESFRSYEMTLWAVEEYFKSYFNSNHWGKFRSLNPATTTDFQLPQITALHPEDNMEDPGQIVVNFGAAVRLLRRHKARDAGKLLESACSNIKTLVREQHPQLLTCLPGLVSYLNTTVFKELLSIVLDQFYEMSSILLGERHPLTNFISSLTKALTSTADVVAKALDVVTTAFSTHAGEFDPARLEAMYYYALARVRQDHHLEAIQILHRLLLIYDKFSDPCGVGPRKVLYSLARSHRKLGNISEAGVIFGDVERRIDL